MKYTFLDGESGDALEAAVHKVLASAAYPAAYHPERVDGNVCVDGGVLDNSPARPLVDAGFRNIVVVHLSDREKDRPEMPGVKFWDVYPLSGDHLEWLFEIDPDLTQRRVQYGYKAAAFYLKDFG